MAGELATEYAVTGWPRGTALAAVGEAFRLWREYRGKGNTEQRQIIEKLVDFIDKFSDARFTSTDTPDEVRGERAGWWRTLADGRQYFFLSHAMREALAGHDLRRGLDALEAAGILDVSRANKAEGRATVFTVQGASKRLYIVNPGVRHAS
ncbi:MAG: hypothetical protein H7835_06350 [Magnetococcus sp. XQGC-1]